MRPLEDVRVLDVTQVVSGPFASMMLADLGAEVTKIERPDGGEIGRTNPPFENGYSTYFTAVNRNKRSVALNLKTSEGQEAFLSLAEEADVIIENNPTGRMKRFGLDYESVQEVNEEIIYCSITGFGQTGPYRDLPALDIITQAMSGVMSITGPPDEQPYRAGIPVGDIAGSMYAVQSVLVALYNRMENGGGEYIDVSMLDSAISWLTVRAGYTFGTDEPYPRMGNKLTEYIPYGIFETADAPLAVVAVSDRHWSQLCEVIERPQLADDDRFRTAAARRENRDQLEPILQSIFKNRSSQEWFERLSKAHVPASPIYDTAEVWEDEHVKSRKLRDTVGDHHKSTTAIRYPVKFERIDPTISRGPPDLGEHTQEALKRAGYSNEEVAKFVEAVEQNYPETESNSTPS